MEQLGTDFNATGSVMSRAELEDQRRKRGECITCGRKCYQKKLFKMIPITDHGRVLEGRCLNCHPLDAEKDGALPAVSRPATQADLARFTRSQNNLGRGSATPPPEQRQPPPHPPNQRSHTSLERGSRVRSHPSSSHSSHFSPTGESTGSGCTWAFGDAHSVSSRSTSRGRDAQLPPTSMTSRDSGGRVRSHPVSLSSHFTATEESTGSQQNSTQNNHALPREAQSISPSRGRDAQLPPTQGGSLRRFPSNVSSRADMGGRLHSSPAMPYNRSHSLDLPRENQGIFDNGDQQEVLDEYDNHGVDQPHATTNSPDYNPQINDESLCSNDTSLLLDYYQRSFHKSSSYRSAGGSVASNTSLDGNGDLGGYPPPDTQQRRFRRVPSREESMVSNESGMRSTTSSSSTTSSLHRQSSDEGLRRFSASSVDRGIVGRRPSATDSLGATSYHGSVDRRPSATNSIDGTSNHGYPSSQQRGNATFDSLAHDDVNATHRNHWPAAEYPRSGIQAPPMMEHSSRYPPRPPTDLDTARRVLQEAGHNFVDLVKCMQEYPTSLEVQVLALHTISNMELTEPDCHLLAGSSLIQVILDTMDSFPGDVELQISGCRAIWNASGTPENQRLFVRLGALETLLQAMSNFPENVVLQELTLAVLANLGANADNLDQIHECNVLEKMVETLGRHASHPDVQVKGCLALSNFAFHSTDYSRTIVECGGGSAIVISMVMHPNHPELQERALRALRNLSANNNQNQMELTNIGGIDAIISAMQVHRDSADVQQVGAWTLANLAGNDDSKVLIGDCGGIDVIIRAMWVHNDKIPVQEWCCRALYSLSSDVRNTRMILELGGVSAIVNAMQAHADAVAIQEMGCAVLCNLATDQQSKMRIVDEEALDAVVLAMVLFTDDPKVQERSCQLLLQLSIAENFKAMQASNVGELVVAAAQKFPERCADPAERLIKVIEGFIAEYL